MKLKYGPLEINFTPLEVREEQLQNYTQIVDSYQIYFMPIFCFGFVYL